MLKNESLRFFIVGNWGKAHKIAQADTADCLAAVAHKVRPQFLVTTGDNFHANGVQKANDFEWELAFETLLYHQSLQIPCFGVMGEKDCEGNPEAFTGYSTKSKRWVMPKRYYSEFCNINGGTGVLFIFLDTNLLNSPDALAREEYDWLAKTLATTHAEWKILIGYHGFSNTPSMDRQRSQFLTDLPKLLEMHNVQAYFSGTGQQVYQHLGGNAHEFSTAILPNTATKDSDARSSCFLDAVLTEHFMQVRCIDTFGFMTQSFHIEKSPEQRPLVFISK